MMEIIEALCFGVVVVMLLAAFEVA